MAKTVFLLRHGKSDWSQPHTADHDRSLNARGCRDAPAMGRWFKQQGLHADLVLSSTATRAKSTALAFAKEAGISEECIVFDRKLYLAEPTSYLDCLIEHSQQENDVLLVGHNPGMSELASRLAAFDIEMPTAALVHFELELDAWRQLDFSTPSRFVTMMRPREL